MTRVKICGLKTLADAQLAAEAGADLLGFNFYPKSPRYVLPQVCAGITSALRAAHPSIQLVGVFVNSSLEEVEGIMAKCGLDLAQLHGDESAAFCAALGSRAYKAFRGTAGIETDERIRTAAAPAFLIDASVKELYGGSGTQADWAEAAKLAARHPFLLAGGLKAENVAEATRQVRPWGVDVASGVESAPGTKDPARVLAFIQSVRRIEAQA
jgi:phosphoribosylanthranilate isomerase